MPAIIFALISYFAWGTGDIFGTIATRKLGSYSTTFWSYIFRVFIFALYIPFAWPLLSNLNLSLITLNIGLGIFLLVGFIAFNEALRIENAPLVGTIAASFASVVFILSIIFLGETISSQQFVSILIIFLGLILSTVSFKDFKNKNVFLSRGVLFAFIAMICWGIYFTFIKIPVQQIGWFWPNYISFLLFPLVYLVAKVRKTKINQPNYKNAFLPLLLTVLLTGIAEFSFNFAISKGLTAIVAPIAGSYPTLFVVLAFLFFKDKITKQQIVGIITTLVGIVLLSIFST